MKLKDYLNIPINSDVISSYKFIESDFIDYIYIPRKGKITSTFSMKNYPSIHKLNPENSVIAASGNHILKLFKECSKQPDNKFIIVIGGTDKTFNNSIFKNIPNNVVRLYAKNVKCYHEKVIPIPIGTDIRNNIYQDYNDFKYNSKLVYHNFSANKNKPYRIKLTNHFKNQPWITYIPVHNFLKYNISGDKFFKDVYEHKFTISPEGRGIDCFRTWDAIYLKSIPIVQRSYHMEQFKELPILFTSDYSEITKEYLEDKYEEMLDTEYNFGKLNFNYWYNMINRDKLSLNV